MNAQRAFEILGLRPPVSEVAVRQAFRRTALRYHPDRFTTFSQQAWATRQFQKAVDARDTALKELRASCRTEAVGGRRASPVGTNVSGSEPNDPSPNPVAPRARRWSSWLLKHAWGDTAAIVIWGAFVFFRIGVWLGRCVFSLFGLSVAPDAVHPWSRALYLLITVSVAGTHIFILYYVGAHLWGDYDSTNGVVWALGYGSPILLFVIAEIVGFVIQQCSRTQLAAELKLLEPSRS